jgi:8-oxo-dGTP pyrophosphatase MutT (NUDIX family)
MARDTRYQAAIVKQDRILLIRWREVEPERTFWIIPGGGRERGESIEACLVREAREETGLKIAAGKLLLEEGGRLDGKRWILRTFLCRVVDGRASPGYEPEDPQPEGYGIVEVLWFDLRDERGWDRLLFEDKITYPQLQKIRLMLGYISEDPLVN